MTAENPVSTATRTDYIVLIHFRINDSYLVGLYIHPAFERKPLNNTRFRFIVTGSFYVCQYCMLLTLWVFILFPCPYFSNEDIISIFGLFMR